MNRYEINRYEKIAIAIFFLVAGISIIETSFLGINGHHTFRQADAYGNILGILGEKNFNLFDLFSDRAPWGERAVFDLPIYQYLVATVSHSLGKDSLVAVRYVNLFLWIITAFFGFRVCNNIGYRFGGLIFVGLFSSSPLFLHYFSVPLPDNFAIALSVMATAFLLDDNRTWHSFLFAFSLIALASAVKSPVPFVFIVFSATYLILLTSETEKQQPVTRFQQHKYIFAFLISCLLVVILLEYYRGLLMAAIGSKSTHSWNWYFGSIELRLSSGFWHEMSTRFNHWVPPYYLYIFLTISAISLCGERKMKNVGALISAVFAFLAGWLIFSNVYKIHDYYQLPVAVVIFMSFSVSASHLISISIKQKWLSSNMTLIFPMVLVLALLIQLNNQDSYSVKVRANFYKAVEYSLRNDNIFLLVRKISDDPTVGGLVSTKFLGISPEEFEGNCNKYLSQYRSILVESSKSECLESAKMSATSYFADDGKVFFRANQPLKDRDKEVN